MTEQEKPGFTVTDKRSGASADSTAESPADRSTGGETKPDSPESESPASPQASPSAQTAASASETQSEPNAAPGGTASKPSQEEPFAPDPAMLLSIAAMQMDTRELAITLVAVFDGHAWQRMGLVANPLTGESQQDLPAAQLAIDCVQFLLGKVESSLSDEERREAQRRLNDLRMNYLAKRRDAQTP